MHLTWITPGPVICVGDWWEEADSQTHLFRGCVQSIHSWKGKSDSEMTSLNIIHHQVWLKCKMQCWAELWECYCAPQGGCGLSPAVFTSGVQLCIHTTTSVCFGTASGFMALDHVGPLEKSRSILLWLETCMVHSHRIKDDIMFVIALNPSGRGHIDFIQQPTHAISSMFMFTTHTISQMRLPTTPPFFVHMVGFEPRFHQWMTHVLPIYLWVEWRCYAYCVHPCDPPCCTFTYMSFPAVTKNVPNSPPAPCHWSVGCEPTTHFNKPHPWLWFMSIYPTKFMVFTQCTTRSHHSHKFVIWSSHTSKHFFWTHHLLSTDWLQKAHLMLFWLWGLACSFLKLVPHPRVGFHWECMQVLSLAPINQGVMESGGVSMMVSHLSVFVLGVTHLLWISILSSVGKRCGFQTEPLSSVQIGTCVVTPLGSHVSGICGHQWWNSGRDECAAGGEEWVQQTRFPRKCLWFCHPTQCDAGEGSLWLHSFDHSFNRALRFHLKGKPHPMFFVCPHSWQFSLSSDILWWDVGRKSSCIQNLPQSPQVPMKFPDLA